MGERSVDRQLARDHSQLLDERLRGFFKHAGNLGPTSFAGLGLGQHPNAVNEYASLGLDDDDEEAPRQRPLQKFVSNITRMLPSGEKLEHAVQLEMRPPPSRPPQHPQQQQQQPPVDSRVHGWLDFDIGRRPKHQQQQPQQQQGRAQPRQQQQPQPKPAKREGSPAPPSQQPQAQAMPVPGNPLKIRLKITRGGSEPRSSPCTGQQQPRPRRDEQEMLEAVRQLGADPLLSPIPASWTHTLNLSPSLAAGQQQQTAAPVAAESPTLGPAALQQIRGQDAAHDSPQAVQHAPSSVTVAPLGQKRAQSPFATSPASRPGAMLQQQQTEAPAVLARAPSGRCSPGGTKRRTAGDASGLAERGASLPGALDLVAEAEEVAPPQLKRQRSGVVAASTGEAAAAAAAPVQRKRSGSLPPAGVTAGGSGPLSTSPAVHTGGAVYDSTHLMPATAAPAVESAAAPRRQRATSPPAANLQQQQLPAVSSASAGAGLGGVAALLPAVLDAAASSNSVPGSGAVQELQKEGKKLKKFAEKRMKDGKPTHISSMFLCQSCVKFLEVAAAMEAHPAKFSRESTASMYSQTASLLDSCAHNSGHAEGPATITQAICLLAQRLAAVARLRATLCLRTEGLQQAAAFESALEKMSGETYQRPSPTDSNTSTSISLPLEASGSGASVTGAPMAAATGAARRRPALVGRQPAAAAQPVAAAAATAATSPTMPLVGMPKPLLERQLLAGRHMKDVLNALSSFGKSGEQLRKYMGQVAAQNNLPGLKAAAATLLLSVDAGMGPAGGVLSMAKEALDAVMQMQ